jgi:hypothetical protein
MQYSAQNTPCLLFAIAIAISSAHLHFYLLYSLHHFRALHIAHIIHYSPLSTLKSIKDNETTCINVKIIEQWKQHQDAVIDGAVVQLR